MVGHELVVVVEADEELSLELLSLDAVQAALLLTPKPAEVGFLRMKGGSLRHFIEELKREPAPQSPEAPLVLVDTGGALVQRLLHVEDDQWLRSSCSLQLFQRHLKVFC